MLSPGKAGLGLFTVVWFKVYHSEWAGMCCVQFTDITCSSQRWQSRKTFERNVPIWHKPNPQSVQCRITGTGCSNTHALYALTTHSHTGTTIINLWSSPMIYFCPYLTLCAPWIWNVFKDLWCLAELKANLHTHTHTLSHPHLPACTARVLLDHVS